MQNAINGGSIQTIVEMDKNARQKVSAAKEEAREILRNADEKQKTMVADYESRAEARLGKVEASYRGQAEEEISVIEADKKAAFERLDKKMADNRDKWKKEIFSAVTGEQE